MSDSKPANAIVPSGGQPIYQVGDRVRVPFGKSDPDFPDIPMGGWAGSITEVDSQTSPIIYLVTWSDQTLAHMPSVYRIRCDREDLDFTQCRLEASDLEVDPGTPLTIEQPKLLVPLPLDLSRWDDRVRKIFKRTTDEPLPEVNETSLHLFHSHFSKVLKFPFTANTVDDETELIVVTSLLALQANNDCFELLVEIDHDQEISTLPLSELEPHGQSSAAKDILAYQEWLDQARVESLAPLPPTTILAKVAVFFFVLMTLAGALIGALVCTTEHALVAAQAGAAILGFAGAIVGTRIHYMTRLVSNQSPRFFMGGFVGLLLGAGAGAVIAILILGYVGSIPGAIAGTLMGQLIASLGFRRVGTFRLTLLGAYLGAHIYAFAVDPSEALRGLVWGTLIAAGIFLTILGLLRFGVVMVQTNRGLPVNEKKE